MIYKIPRIEGKVNNFPSICLLKNGNVKSERYYINDKLSGFYNFYYPTGEILVIGSFFNNKRDGIWKFYDKNKKLKIVKNIKMVKKLNKNRKGF